MRHPNAPIWLLTLLMVAAVTACGDSSDTTEAGATETASTVTDSTEAATTADLPKDGGLSYPIVDTGQVTFYGNEDAIDEPADGEAFSNQDAAYDGYQPSYTDNGDGTVTDNVTGLMWQQDPSQNLTYDEAVDGAATFDLGGYDDWRLPTIKELYSLILFSGTDPSGCDEIGADCETAIPFIDTDYFNFEYGDTSADERMIDAQYASSNVYVGTTRVTLAFGVNFADGRIKGYGLTIFGQDKTFDVLYVRGTTDYGINDFVDNGDDTITDLATGLTWTQADNGEAVSWEDALDYCATLDTTAIDGWRLPSVKELQSIVDYTRSPSTTDSAAIDSLFTATEIVDEDGSSNFPFYWSSTTHTSLVNGRNAAYVAFGEALGWMQDPSGDYTLEDVHGAGAQRSDPKTGDASEFPYGFGPQGDVIRITNYAMCVVDG